MSNPIQVFTFKDSLPIRSLLIDSDPWFFLTDICKILGLDNPTKVKNRLDERDTQVIDFNTLISNQGVQINNLHGNTVTTVVNESGLYD